MKFNINQKLAKLTGEPLMWQEPNKLTGLMEDTTNQVELREVIVNSVLAKEAKDGKEKLANYDLAQRLQKVESDVEITSDEAVLIKSAIEKNYGTLIYGQACRMIEPITPEKK